MRKILTVLALSALLFACSSGPEKAAESFVENLAKGKVEEAKKYATEPTGKMIDLTSAFGGLPINPNYKFEVVEKTIDGNKATVTFKNEEGETNSFELVKIDGKWLVHIESKK